MSNDDNAPKSFLTHLAGLRGIAILLVVLFHLNGDVFHEGYLGVDVFLIISGYLLIAAWLRKKDASLFGDFSHVQRGQKLYMQDAHHISPPVAIELLRVVRKERVIEFIYRISYKTPKELNVILWCSSRIGRKDSLRGLPLNTPRTLFG